ncbi:MAG: glycosyltransferase family 4 protein [Proteobacteria bacterium]|nr:glycosyltransferase family 4 protein [Pseudomonadota bacterium]MBU6426369.1 glycosyltransferase family 4 protein [Rhodospirillales bacterium]
MAETAIILPPRESFTPAAAGAIALVARRFALALPGAVVLGHDSGGTFPGIAFQRAGGFLQLVRALRQLRPKVIEVHQKPRWAMALALLFPQAKVLLFLHNDPLTMRGLRTRLGRRLALKLLHRVVCVSAYLAGRYAQGLAQDPAVLPNPLSPEEMPALVEKQPVILFAGRIVADKGPDIFIAACAKALPSLPGWRAEMIGGDRFGPDSPESRYFITQREAARTAGITFHGPLPHGAVLAAMNRAAIVVVPSRWAEPFGLTALEAMATGAALVTTGQGGLREVAGEAALYTPPGDADALAETLAVLTKDAAIRDALAEAGRARAREFFTPAIAPRLQALRDGV